MPVIFPTVPHGEHDVRTRIRRKYSLYVHDQQKSIARPDKASLQGERYEILCAVDLFKRGKITDGDQIGYKSPLGGLGQSISVGANTEYDFALRDLSSMPGLAHHGPPTGPVLVEAKSYRNGLGPYMRKGIGYLLNDPTIGGLFFIAPASQDKLWEALVTAAYEVLSGRVEADAITGGNQWRTRAAVANKPTGAAVVAHFAYYRSLDRIQERARQPVPVVHAELTRHAGFAIGVWSLAKGDHQAVVNQVNGL